MARTLIAFDFDGTLSDSEMTVLLGDRHGVAKEMRRITDRAMNDEIGYAESLRTRVGLLAGLSEADVEAAFDSVRLRSGAADVLGELQMDPKVITAILTGGFERGVEHALDRNGATVDRIVANRLKFAGGELSGAVDGPLVEGTKDKVLNRIGDEFDIPASNRIAVGDGANDLPMLRVAGLSIGFRPKPVVQPHCDTIVDSMTDLLSVLDGVRTIDQG